MEARPDDVGSTMTEPNEARHSFGVEEKRIRSSVRANLRAVTGMGGPTPRRLMLVVDSLLLIGAVPAAAAIHTLLQERLPFLHQLAVTRSQLVLLPIVTVPLFLALITGFDLDKLFEGRLTWRDLLFRLLKVHATAFLAIAALVFLSQAVVNRSFAAAYFVLTFTSLFAYRAALLRWREFQYRRGEGRQRLLLVGAPSTRMQLFISHAGLAGYPPEFVGVLAPDETTGEVQGVARLGVPEKLAEVLHERAVDRVLFFPPYNRAEETAALLDVCETVGVPAEFLVELPRPTLADPRIVLHFDRPFVSFDVAPRSAEALAVKHALDVLAAAVLLILLSPILIFTALAILLTMGRPIFFTQERAGLFGRTFRMRKFRTMKVGAEAMRDELVVHNEAGGPVFKMTNDPRITPLGRILRKTSIDELPQLFHVLTGTMSLVGPRPLPVKEQASIRGWHRRRLSMKPGITGLWQVSGRSNLAFEDWMRLDLEYVDRWSLALDFKLLLKTLPVVLLGRGAK